MAGPTVRSLLSRPGRIRRVVPAVAAGVALALAAGQAAVADPDWNLGNTLGSQVADLNAQSTGAIRNDGLGRCVDDLNGNLANGAAVVSNACATGINQTWTYNRVSDAVDDGTIRAG